jgi:hypothetical protein
MSEAGYKGISIHKGIGYLSNHWEKARKNPYALSLIANAFAFTSPDSPVFKSILEALENLKTEEKDLTYWSWSGQTACYARGISASVETTALCVYAMMKSQSHFSTAHKGLQYLLKQRSPDGMWGSTQSTIMVLKILLNQSLFSQQEEASIDILINGNKTAEWKISDKNCDIVQLADLKAHTRIGSNQIAFETRGKVNILYQIVSRYYRPWESIKDSSPSVNLQVSYDKTLVEVDDTITAKADFTYSGKSPTYMVILDLGIPAGFKIHENDFEKLVDDKVIERYSISSNQVTLYLGNVTPGSKVSFDYRLTALNPLKIKTPKSTAYEYYSPHNRCDSAPVELEVTAK